MSLPDDLPSPRETTLAYGTTGLASLVWIACVVPGAILADPSLASDLATPMARGPLFLLPALLLLVTLPIAMLLAARVDSMRSLLAASDAFVTLFSAGILLAGRNGDTPRLVAALALLVLFVVAVRDAFLPAKAGPRPAADASGAVPGGGGSLRLALAVTALLMPASLLTRGPVERAGYLAPFAYVALSALGSRLAHGLLGLRLTAAVLLVGVAIHQIVAIRYAVVDGKPLAAGWTPAGYGALGLGAACLAITGVWTTVLALRLRRAWP